MKLPKGLRQIKPGIKRLLAAERRRRLGGIPFIAVTGSAGKSSTVAMLDHILSGERNGVCAAGANNSRKVVSSLRRARLDAEYFLVEVSAERPGALDERIGLLKPNLAVVTTVGLDHKSAFRTCEAVAAEKGKLVECLPADGIAILNADNPHVFAMASRTRARVVTFGLAEGADVRAVDVTFTWPDRLGFTVEVRGARRRVQTRLVGKHFAPSALAAIATALELGLSLDSCADRLASMEPVYQRMSVHRHPTGAWFIADSYKAAAWSLAASFAVLEGARAPRRTVVIGHLSDTAGHDQKSYSRAARAALDVADRVVLVGEKAKYASKLLNGPEADRVTLIPRFVDFIDWLDRNLIEDEVVILKSVSKSHLERAFLFPRFGAFCTLDSCTKGRSCAVCSVTAGIDGLREAVLGGRSETMSQIARS
ncbi:MAG TPA: Mur ligase family protein [Thermohalobaculum sp.]|nr:Mur ligase family protein [Thermohalobaculum sp.]